MPDTRPPKITMMLIPPDPGRKQTHLALITHKGGGWYTARCAGQAKRCKAGECRHIQNMRWKHSNRPIRPVPWEDEDAA